MQSCTVRAIYCMSESLSSAGPGETGTGLDTVSFLFPQDSHFLGAGTGSHCCTAGPPDEIRIRQSSAPVFRRLRWAVLILFIVEKRRSTSALEAGRTPMHARILKMRG